MPIGEFLGFAYSNIGKKDALWIYFAIVGACLGIICVIINRFVYYEND